MSLYSVQHAIYLLKRDKVLAERFKAAPDEVLSAWELSDAERQALRNGDFVALYRMGVHPLLLAPYSRLLGVPRPQYLAALAVAKGERRMVSALGVQEREG